ncbi:glycosyltransferase [Clostridium gasigenes]|uniref:glycosyltransferase n=1 Tax=Clostridium gasigenes TaxID=94869 RepID=UPI001C0BE60E|nr:glycosyltransferase [Clostridium gasigenes]MBU3132934.1 glycosyltransferase [Clostridium gasigenes]
MNTLISLVMIVSDINNFHFALKNITSQSLINWELFLIFKSKDLNIITPLSDSRIHIVERKDETSLINCLLTLFPHFEGDLIAILNSSDIQHHKRLERQSSFMKQNSSLSICSCLELPLTSKSKLKNTSNDSNNFITANEIDFATLGGYVPLDIYTFMMQKSFLLSITKFLLNYSLDTELDFILYLLRYTSIEKIPEVLYYFRNARIPYPESIMMDNSLNSSNKISIFNTNKCIEYRNYLYEAIIKDSNISILNNDIKYNILVIIDSLNIGGTETYIFTISMALRNFGIYTYILTSGGVLEDLFVQNNIPVLKINLRQTKNEPQSYWGLINYIREIIAKYNIKLIQFHLPNDIPLCCDLKKFLDIPIILTLHGTFYSKDLIKNYSIYISKIIFVSKEVETFYSHCLPNDDKVSYSLIPNTIEPYVCAQSTNFLHKLLNLPNDGRIILYCSRLSSGKAPAAIMFLKSFEKITCNDPNLYAVILGDGDSKILIDSYAKTINSLYKAKRVFVLGAVYNVNDYYSDSILVIGTGRVALEAMNCSKPVITLGLNGLVEIVNENNISDMICTNFGDHTSKANTKNLGIYSEYLTQSITYLLNNTKFCESLGRWCKGYCNKNLNLINTAHSISKLFDDLLNLSDI